MTDSEYVTESGSFKFMVSAGPLGVTVPYHEINNLNVTSAYVP